MTNYPREVRTGRLKPGSVIAGIANRPLQVRKITQLAPDSGYVTLLCLSKAGDFLQVTRHIDRPSILVGFDDSNLDDHGPRARRVQKELPPLGDCESCLTPMARKTPGPAPEGTVRHGAKGLCATCYARDRRVPRRTSA